MGGVRKMIRASGQEYGINKKGKRESRRKRGRIFFGTPEYCGDVVSLSFFVFSLYKGGSPMARSLIQSFLTPQKDL